MSEEPSQQSDEFDWRLNNSIFAFERTLIQKDLIGARALLYANPNLLAYMESDGREPLHRVVDYRHFAEAVPLLLHTGATVDLPNDKGRTPLLEALYYASATEIVEALIQAGANVNALDSEGMSALHLSVDRPAHDTSGADEANIRLLLAYGADASRVNSEGLTPLALAFFRTNSQAVRLLRAIDAPYAAGDGYLTPSPMDWAISEDDCNAVRALLDAGADVNERNEGGITPLHAASFGGCVDIVRLLLARGADIHATSAPPDEPEYGGLTALHEASSQPKVTRILLDTGAAPTVRGGIDNRTSVEQAVVEGSLAVAQLYHECDAPLSQECLEDAFEYQVSSGGNPEFIAQLIEWGAGREQEALQRAARAAIYYFNTDNLGLLFAAGLQLAVNESTLYGEMEDVRGSLERGGDPNEIYVEGQSLTEPQYSEWQVQAEARRQEGEFVESWVRTPIVSAARANDIEKACLLLAHGADPNFMMAEIGDAALFSAVEHNNVAMLALLLEHGADPNAPLSRCASPLEMAEQEGYEECAALLRQAIT